jgi:hypothetical protein
VQIHELTILSLSLHKHVEEFSLAVAFYKAAASPVVASAYSSVATGQPSSIVRWLPS